MSLLLLKTPLSALALDKPNARSLHVHHTPRIGGLAINLGIVTAWIVGHVNFVWLFLVLALVMVSLVDDVRGLSVRWRLLAQLIVSSCFIWVLLPNMAWWMLAVVLFLLVWMTNLYNFMDGSDGLAGGMAVFGFTAYAMAAYWAKDLQLVLMCAAVVGAGLAFLCFNVHPAKIFMGDAGSIPLGFLAGAIGVYGWQQTLWPLWFPLIVFSPFVVDATVTLIKRALRHEKVWHAHREHYYQKLVQLGWGHKKTAIAEYVLMLLVTLTALLMLKLPHFWICFFIILWAFSYLLMMRLIDKHWKKHLTL